MRIPFDADRLETLMNEAGMSLLLAHTRHNLRYLTGGYYHHFHVFSTRMGTSQYLPLVGIPRGRLEEAFYIGRIEERDQIEEQGLWTPNFFPAVRGTGSAAASLINALGRLGLGEAVIGVELSFLPADVYLALVEALPRVRIIDATPVLEELRVIKTEAELAHMSSVYERVAEAIQAAFAGSGEGDTTVEIEGRVRHEMTRREVGFLFALVSAGPGFSRTPSAKIQWERGQILHIDAGGEVGDYLADICRMGCIGEPSPLARDLHAACLEVQDRARAVVRAGTPCGAVVAEGERAAKGFPFSAYARFVAHSIGMVPYEKPSFSPGAARLLEAGMVLSIETDFIHPKVGHVKIEDSVVVTETGCRGMGDLGRGWHIR